MRRLFAAVVLTAGAQPLWAADVTVAVAANFAQVLESLAPGFSAATGHTLKLSSGSTGKLYSQILAGAPFEVLLSADDETPRRLADEGHAVVATRFTYAVGRLVLWSATPGLVDAQGAVLTGTGFKYLAIANPRTAPYGRAALEVLRARGLADALAPRLVTGESIAQAYQFVATGNAELGFIALSQLQGPGKPGESGNAGDAGKAGNAGKARKAASGSSWLVPAALHGEIRQDAVLLKAGKNSPAAKALLDYLKSDAARAAIRTYGYGP